MRVKGKSNRVSSEKSPRLAAVALQFGRYVSVQSQQLLQRICNAKDPVAEVEKHSLDDFAEAGMDELCDPFQKNGAGKEAISEIRERSE